MKCTTVFFILSGIVTCGMGVHFVIRSFELHRTNKNAEHNNDRLDRQIFANSTCDFVCGSIACAYLRENIFNASSTRKSAIDDCEMACTIEHGHGSLQLSCAYSCEKLFVYTEAYGEWRDQMITSQYEEMAYGVAGIVLLFISVCMVVILVCHVLVT